MNSKPIAFTVLTTLLVTLPVSIRAEDIDLRTRYELCSRFPDNPKCEGYDVPVLMDNRPGYPINCLFRLAVHGSPSRQCKIELTNDGGITAYQETGDPVEYLNNQRTTIAIPIAHSQIFSLNYQAQRRTSKVFLFIKESDYFGGLEIGFLAESASVYGNRSNFVNFYTSPAIAASLHHKLARSRSLLSSSEIVEFISVGDSDASNTAEAVQRLQETKICIRCNLSGANLEDIDLSGVNLEGANLEGATLRESQLTSAYLMGANLRRANLLEAKLTSSELRFAILAGAELTHANLQGANLSHADLQGANLSEAHLIAPTTMQQTNLANAILKEADLRGINLEGANLVGANLEDADLRSTRLNGATIPILNPSMIVDPGLFTIQTVVEFTTNLRGANLSGANLTRTDLDNALLLNANLSNAILNKTDLDDANLCNAMMPDGSMSSQGCEKDNASEERE
jgi:uncharacterized protein YjbI with pentapeptide repeats